MFHSLTMPSRILSYASPACQTYCRTRATYMVLVKNIRITSVLGLPTSLKFVNVNQVRNASSGKSPAKMQAWQVHQYGDNEELTFTDRARAASIKAPNELLIKVHAASVNPIDVRMRAGYGSKILNTLRKRQGGMIGSEFPLILGRDFSGTVIEAGRAVKRFRPGDEVWGALNGFRQGSHAQFTVAAESEVSKKPKTLSHTEAASIPYVAVTSWTALCTVGELKEKRAASKRILIQGGSGGVGTFSIQLLKAWGADVTATCGTEAVGMLQELGADTVIDYQTTDAKTELSRLPPFDFVLDAVGGSTADDSFELLKKWTNAKLVTLVTPLLRNIDSEGFVPGAVQSAFSLGTNIFRGLTGGRSYRWAFFLPNGKALGVVSHMVDSGQIRPVLEKTVGFSQLPDAYAHVEKGKSKGKTVINITDQE